MIEKFFLVGEKVRFVSVSSLDDFRSKRFSWVRVLEPTEEECALLAQYLGFDEQDQEEFLSFLEEGDRSRVEKDKFMTIIYSVPVIVNKEVETEELLVFCKKDIVLTVERKKLSVCDRLHTRLKKQQGKYHFKKNSGFFLTELIDEITGRFSRHVNKIESSIDLLSGKNKLLTSKQVEAISSANNTLSFFNQATLANIEVLNTLRKMYHPTFTSDDREAFADIYFDALQIRDTLKIQREVIMNIFNIQSIISSNQMNMFMKKLTALALIIMIPTLISGVYGMNLSNLPFATHTHGFWLVLTLMLVITGALYVVFKKSDWL